MGIRYVDLEKNVDDCVTKMSKNGLTIFRIIETRCGYIAEYFDNSLFKSPSLSYDEASKIAREKYGENSKGNMLKAAKVFFMEDYISQTKKRMKQLQEMDIEYESMFFDVDGIL